MALEICYACLCEEALNILLTSQILIQVKAGDLGHLWVFRTFFFLQIDVTVAII